MQKRHAPKRAHVPRQACFCKPPALTKQSHGDGRLVWYVARSTPVHDLAGVQVLKAQQQLPCVDARELLPKVSEAAHHTGYAATWERVLKCVPSGWGGTAGRTACQMVELLFLNDHTETAHGHMRLKIVNALQNLLAWGIEPD